MPSRIIVVDDEHTIADSVAEIIAGAGYEVRSCYSGAEALLLLDEFEPNLLLSDVLMPGLNGFELGLSVKQRFPACRLLLFSGQAATAIMAQNFIERFNSRGYRFELLPKPLHPGALLAKIEEALLQAV
ncbi:MAG TPA: response regulator [Candidatus Acidoferrales bacterium]|jgi:DNA-binding NtrC family response regulator|nr:response regulator [Candidatus Acidoferrales bacterium]